MGFGEEGSRNKTTKKQYKHFVRMDQTQPPSLPFPQSPWHCLLFQKKQSLFFSKRSHFPKTDHHKQKQIHKEMPRYVYDSLCGNSQNTTPSYKHSNSRSTHFFTTTNKTEETNSHLKGLLVSSFTNPPAAFFSKYHRGEKKDWFERIH